MKKTVGGGMGLLDVLAIVFIILKLVGVISWSWWAVLAPIWIPLFIIIICIILYFVADAMSDK